MLITVYPNNPNTLELGKAVDILRNDGVIIYPTDSVYGMACDINSKKGVEKIARIKGVKSNKIEFSIICHDLNFIAEYTQQIDRPTYRLIKQSLPGPFTFILNGNNKVPKLFNRNKKTVGVRIPNNNIALELVNLLGNPLLSTSVHDEDEIIAYTTDPLRIYEKYQHDVNLVIDGGYGNNEVSTIIDCTGSAPEIIRQGLGVLPD